jgi:hypothetical protein
VCVVGGLPDTVAGNPTSRVTAHRSCDGTEPNQKGYAWVKSPSRCGVYWRSCCPNPSRGVAARTPNGPHRKREGSRRSVRTRARVLNLGFGLYDRILFRRQIGVGTYTLTI